MIDDPTLLRRYAADRADDAFAELVRRHLPMVYSAALRRLSGDTHLAEDVSQVVFTSLARNASTLSQHPALTGWLYTATRYAVVDVVRSQSRRRAREKEAYIMQEMFSESEAPADWSQLRPVLDTAMDKLSSRDRDAVLLRFFEGRPFAEIGARLGLSEDAARKRVERALDQLRVLLRRHGVASTSAALATLLTGGTVTAAPAGLAASITGTALSSAVSTTGLVTTFMTMSKLQAGLAAVVLAGGVVGFVLQQRTVATLHESATVTEERAARLARENAALDQTRSATESELARMQVELTATQRARATAATPTRRLPLTTDSPQQRAALHRKYDPFFAQIDLTPDKQERFIDALIYQAEARADLQAAVASVGLAGDSVAVEKIRRKLYEPMVRELLDVLEGQAGYDAMRAYDETASVRVVFLPSAHTALAAAGIPLSAQQAEQLLPLFAQNMKYVHEKPADILAVGHLDWPAFLDQAGAILTPPQVAALRAFAQNTKDTFRITRSFHPPVP
jgi:RNA polymerase sigma factor (sigma-70 family)